MLFRSRELRAGHKAVVTEVHTMKKQLADTMTEKLAQMEDRHQRTCADFKSDIEALKQLIVHGKRAD